MITCRKLVPADLAAWRALIGRLDPDDRRNRFAGQVGDAALDAHVRGMDWLSGVAVGAFVDGVLRGAAELRAFAPLDRRAEFAIAVERAFQRRGIGTQLTLRALVLAQNRGVVRVTMFCLAGNHAMRAIAARLGFRLEFEDGMLAADIAVRLPDHASLIRELGEEVRALGVELIDRLAPPVPRLPA